MNRDQGLRRPSVLTASLIAAGLAGSIGIGIAAHAADQSSRSSATSSTTGSGSSTSSNDSPAVSSGSDDSGQATSRGS